MVKFRWITVVYILCVHKHRQFSMKPVGHRIHKDIINHGTDIFIGKADLYADALSLNDFLRMWKEETIGF